MPRSISPQGGGDHGRAARASLLSRPAVSLRLRAMDMAVFKLIAASSGLSLNALLESVLLEWLRTKLPVNKGD